MKEEEEEEEDEEEEEEEGTTSSTPTPKGQSTRLRWQLLQAYNELRLAQDREDTHRQTLER